MRTLVVSGGIGSGKSMVCAFLAEKGAAVYDADSRTKALYHGPLTDRIEAAFGCSFRTEGGIDFAALARVAFASQEALAALEEIVHPAVKEDFLSWRAEQEAPLIVLESAIILDKPLFDGLYDTVALVYAPEELRVERVLQRNPGLSREDVRRRIAAQHIDIARADYLLINDSGPDALRAQALALFDNLIEHSAGR